MSEVIRQRRMQANYLNCSNDGKTKAFALLGVGAKTLDENPSAQTKSRKYVCDKSATKSISGYDWNTAFDIDQIREQDAINFIVNIGENQLVGEDVCCSSRGVPEQSGSGTWRCILRYVKCKLQLKTSQCRCLHSGISGWRCRGLRRYDSRLFTDCKSSRRTCKLKNHFLWTKTNEFPCMQCSNPAAL